MRVTWIGSVQGAVATWSDPVLFTSQVATALCTDPAQVRSRKLEI